MGCLDRLLVWWGRSPAAASSFPPGHVPPKAMPAPAPSRWTPPLPIGPAPSPAPSAATAATAEVNSWIERGLTARDIAAEVSAGRPLRPRTPASYVRATWYCTLPHDTEAGEIGFAVKPVDAELPHRYALPTAHAEHLLQSLALSLGFTLLKIAEPSPAPFVPVRPRQPDGEP